MLAILSAIVFAVAFVLELLGTEELRYAALFLGLALLALSFVWSPNLPSGNNRR